MSTPLGNRFQFTRHLISCNNIEAGKSLFGKDFEPSATIEGTLTTIGYSKNKDNKSAYISSHVCVSNLLRTWITAFLLYGTHNTTGVLSLFICPYLKEHDKVFGTVKRGNFPKDIKHTTVKFLQFLHTMKELHDMFFRLMRKGPDDTPEIKKKREKLVDFSRDYYTNLPNKVVLFLPPEKYDNELPQQIIFEKKGFEKYKILTDTCLIDDSVGPLSPPDAGFVTNGNLQSFMEWFDGDSNYYKTKFPIIPRVYDQTIHVVTHSNVMQGYFEGKDVTKYTNKNIYDEAIKTNVWRFRTNTASDIESGDVKLTVGVKKNKENATAVENLFKDISLCGNNGSVVAPTCGIPKSLSMLSKFSESLRGTKSSQGGKTTRRRKKRTTKKRQRKSTRRSRRF